MHSYWKGLLHAHKCLGCSTTFSCNCPDADAYWGDCANCQRETLARHGCEVLIYEALLTSFDREFLEEMQISHE